MEHLSPASYQPKMPHYSSAAEDGSNQRTVLAELPPEMNLLCDAINRLTMGDRQLMTRLIQQRELEERGGPVRPKKPQKASIFNATLCAQ